MMFLSFFINFGVFLVLFISSLVLVEELLSLLRVIYLYLFLLLSLIGLKINEYILLLNFNLICFDFLICFLFLNYLIIGSGFFFILYLRVVDFFLIKVIFFISFVNFGVVFVGFLVVIKNL